jgi:glycosyltransferase involved in cell wall biosynthesis
MNDGLEALRNEDVDNAPRDGGTESMARSHSTGVLPLPLVTGAARAEAPQARNRKPHVLFLNAQDALGADIAVHLMLARTLDRSQVRVSAATSLREAPGVSARSTFESIEDLTLLTLDLGRPIGRHRGLARALPVLHNLRGMFSLVGLARWCRSHDVDVIHVTERPRQALFGLLVAQLAGCACIIHAHTNYYGRDASRFSNWRLHRADAVVGVSNFVASTFQQLGKLPANRVFGLHNAVDGDLFRPDVADAARLAMRRRLGVPPDAILIGCVARLMQWKGQETLLDAFAIVRQTYPHAHLVLAGVSAEQAPDGQGDYRDYLVRRIAALGLEDAVTFPGFLPQTDMPEFYGALDLVAHPSVEEPFGLAVVEAMAASRPVIAVNRGGIPEIISDGVDGLLVPAEQPAAMAAAINRVIEQPAFAAELARAGRTRVLEKFTPEIQANRMLEIYQTVLARRRAQPTVGVA